MRSHIALSLLLFTGIGLGQAPPPEVDQELRARVNQFFQYHVEGGAGLRRAMDMVAEDTKDEYFSSGKIQVQKFAITGIEYGPDFTNARVSLDVEQKIAILGQAELITMPMKTAWKVEDGKWMWHLDRSNTWTSPMAEKAGVPATAENATGTIPADLAKPELFNARAQSIMRGSKLDRENVGFRWGVPSEQTVTFLNSHPYAELEVGGIPEVPGFTVSLDKAVLQAGENGVIRFKYAPPEGFDPATVPPPQPFSAQLEVTPFAQRLRIRVSFSPR